MRRNPIVTGVIAGAVAASATAGALVAMGRRLGSAALPFRAIADVFAGPGPRSLDASPGAVVSGIVAHLTIIVLWGLLFALLVDRWRGRSVSAAIVVSIAALAISWVMARTFGRGLATVLPLGDRIVLAVVFALALVVGIRLALPRARADVMSSHHARDMM